MNFFLINIANVTPCLLASKLAPVWYKRLLEGIFTITDVPPEKESDKVKFVV